MFAFASTSMFAVNFNMLLIMTQMQETSGHWYCNGWTPILCICVTRDTMLNLKVDAKANVACERTFSLNTFAAWKLVLQDWNLLTTKKVSSYIWIKLVLKWVPTDINAFDVLFHFPYPNTPSSFIWFLLNIICPKDWSGKIFHHFSQNKNSSCLFRFQQRWTLPPA